jgi:signal peptidase I
VTEALVFWLFGVVGLLLRSTVPPTRETSATPATGVAAIDKGKSTPLEAQDGVREVVETVVFVVVLVLLLKAFLAEAFVIPTGSMATTLYGYHREVECPACKFRFPINMSRQLDAAEARNARIVTGCTCPNCFLPFRLKDVVWPPPAQAAPQGAP